MKYASAERPQDASFGQTRESGEAGRLFGLKFADYIAQQLELKRLNSRSNKVVWAGKRAVIKSCGPKTAWYGVPVGVLERIDVILTAFVVHDRFEVWKLGVEDFKEGMRDSLSRSARGGRVKQNSKSFTRQHGVHVATLQLPIPGETKAP